MRICTYQLTFQGIFPASYIHLKEATVEGMGCGPAAARRLAVKPIWQGKGR